ncbi:hypothetical protein AVEN_68549-1 [Araneus ventricosus]|uniref:Uncharacterized protein n=1 Tax=Araneus ventricosus TaxID=182803 RepID=A0A4Y2HCU6_ARAVE|nr:hypothetical protein AVEN_68549-1 [Araneus ventricosus]
MFIWDSRRLWALVVHSKREPTIVSDPRSIRVHFELTICNLRFNVNNSELNWGTGQFNKVIKFVDIQNTTQLGEPANPDLNFWNSALIER